MVLPTLILNLAALTVGAAALTSVNRLRPVAARLCAGVLGIGLTAYGAVATVDLAAPAVLPAAPDAPGPVMVASVGPDRMLMCFA